MHICPESLPQLKPRCSGPSPAVWQWQGENVGLAGAARVKNVAHRWQPMCPDSCMVGLSPFFSSLPLIALCPAALQLWGKESQHEKDIFKVVIYIWNSKEQLKLRWGRRNDCLSWNPSSLSAFFPHVCPLYNVSLFFFLTPALWHSAFSLVRSLERFSLNEPIFQMIHIPMYSCRHSCPIGSGWMMLMAFSQKIEMISELHLSIRVCFVFEYHSNPK